MNSWQDALAKIFQGKFRSNAPPGGKRRGRDRPPKLFAAGELVGRANFLAERLLYSFFFARDFF
jgi:hypothetical protein